MLSKIRPRGLFLASLAFRSAVAKVDSASLWSETEMLEIPSSVTVWWRNQCWVRLRSRKNFTRGLFVNTRRLPFCVGTGSIFYIPFLIWFFNIWFSIPFEYKNVNSSRGPQWHLAIVLERTSSGRNFEAVNFHLNISLNCQQAVWAKQTSFKHVVKTRTTI